MNILFIGDFNKTWYTGVHITESFRALGHTVTKMHEYLATGELILKEVEKNHYDFVLFSKHYSDIDRLDEIQKKVVTIGWTLDLYFGLRRGLDIGITPFWKHNIVCSPDGGHDKEFEAKGVNHKWIRPAVYDKECSCKDLPKKHDIIFVGSVDSYPAEWQYRKKLVKWLRKHYGDKFEIYPQDKQIRDAELNKLYETTKIVIGDCIYSPDYTSDRIYETIGRGGFIIYPRNTGLGLVDNEHFVGYYYDDFEALKKKIDFYLVEDAERERIRKAGYEYVLKHHTYLNRCEEVIKIYKDYVKQ
jgi:glycosyltransferase involved in cell wall biosynthesis